MFCAVTTYGSERWRGERTANCTIIGKLKKNRAFFWAEKALLIHCKDILILASDSERMR